MSLCDCRLTHHVMTFLALGFFTLALVRPGDGGNTANNPMHLGCWTEATDRELAAERVIPDMDDRAVNYTHSSTVLSVCEKTARERGFMVFGVRDAARCVGSVHAELLYMKYGPSQKCGNGTGGPSAIDFYNLGASETDVASDEDSKRNFINGAQLNDWTVASTGDTTRVEQVAWADLPPSATEHPLIIKGRVRPVVIQPLFKEIDELQYGVFHPPHHGVNILVNPSFELPLGEDLVHGWSCQGDTNDTRGGIIAQYADDHHGDGKRSGICLARLFAWAGPGQYIGRKVRAERAYKFLGWTQLLDIKKTGDLHSLEFWIRYKKRGEKKVYKQLLARRVKGLQNTGWVQWNTAFELPAAPRGFSFVFIYFMGPKGAVDILLDDLYLSEIYQDPDWKTKSDVLIDRYRKRTAILRINVPRSLLAPELLSSVRVDIRQKTHQFGFGAATNSKILLTNKKYREFFLDNFEWAVLESSLKWDVMEKSEGHNDYTTDDEALELLEKHNIPIRGHCLFWASPEEVPYWVKKISSPTRLKSILKTRLETLLGRYKGRFVQWDVNNEMLHGSFFRDRLGPNIRDWMYNAAADVDPKADLFINDFEAVENGQLTEALLEQVQGFLQRGIPIDGLGLQGHFTGHVTPAVLKYRLDTLSRAGVPLWLTEVDILEQQPEKRADGLETVMRTAFSHPSARGLILWSFWDSAAWRGKNVGLVDGWNWQVNEAGLRYQNLLKNWTTKGTLLPYTTDTNGASFVFRGFHGKYDVTVHLPSGKNMTREFILHPGSTRFEVPFSFDNERLDNQTASYKHKIGRLKQSFILVGEANSDETAAIRRSSLATTPQNDSKPTIQNGGGQDKGSQNSAEQGEWTTWSRCDRTCGSGHQRRTRTCARRKRGVCEENGTIEVKSCKLTECSGL